MHDLHWNKEKKGHQSFHHQFTDLLLQKVRQFFTDLPTEKIEKKMVIQNLHCTDWHDFRVFLVSSLFEIEWLDSLNTVDTVIPLAYCISYILFLNTIGIQTLFRNNFTIIHCSDAARLWEPNVGILCTVYKCLRRDEKKKFVFNVYALSLGSYRITL